MARLVEMRVCWLAGSTKCSPMGEGSLAKRNTNHHLKT